MECRRIVRSCHLNVTRTYAILPCRAGRLIEFSSLHLTVMTVLSRLFFVGAALWSGHLGLLASEDSTQFTLDLPVAATQVLPSWLGCPTTSGDAFAALDLPITPPDANASLLVTVFYQEANGGFLRISWQDGTSPPSPGTLPGPGEVGASSVLSDNLYEGIAMNNQRSLLVAADAMKHPGTLHFQAGGSALGISRIKLEWLQNSAGLASPSITETLVTSASGTTALASALAGTPAAALEPAWHDHLVDVPVTDAPVRIEQGVDFTVHLDSLPTRARLAVKETGLPAGQHLVVWLNSRRAGLVMPSVPPLGDPGYSSSATDAPYIGWRDGTFLVPNGSLVSGNNVLQFSAEPDFAPGTVPDATVVTTPLALKDVNLQLDYPATPVAAATTAAPPAAPPAPDVASSTPSIPPNNIAP